MNPTRRTTVPKSDSRRKTKPCLRLVEPSVSDLPLILLNRSARVEFEELSQRLVDIVIEILDLADGDPDIEASGDESEDSDGV